VRFEVNGAAHGSKFRILLLLSLPPTSASSGCLTLTLTLTLTLSTLKTIEGKAPKRRTFADSIHLSDLTLRRLGSRKLALRVCTILLQSLQDIPTCTLFSPPADLHCRMKKRASTQLYKAPEFQEWIFGRNRNCQISPALRVPCIHCVHSTVCFRFAYSRILSIFLPGHRLGANLICTISG